MDDLFFAMARKFVGNEGGAKKGLHSPSLVIIIPYRFVSDITVVESFEHGGTEGLGARCVWATGTLTALSRRIFAQAY